MKQKKYISGLNTQEKKRYQTLMYGFQPIIDMYKKINKNKTKGELLKRLIHDVNFRKNVKTSLLNVDRTIALLSKIPSYVDLVKGKWVAVILGDTGTGKSSLTNLLMGNELEEYTTTWGDIGLKLTNAEQPSAKIGQSLSVSETLYAQAYEIPKDTLDDDLNYVSQWLRIVDTAGWLETRGDEYSLCAHLCLDQVLSQSEGVISVILTLTADMFRGSRMGPVMMAMMRLVRIFPDALTTEFPLMIVITKYDDAFENGYTERLDQLMNEHRSNRSNQDTTNLVTDEGYINVLTKLKNTEPVFFNLESGSQRTDLISTIVQSIKPITVESAMDGPDIERYGKAIHDIILSFMNRVFKVFNENGDELKTKIDQYQELGEQTKKIEQDIIQQNQKKDSNTKRVEELDNLNKRIQQLTGQRQEYPVVSGSEPDINSLFSNLDDETNSTFNETVRLIKSYVHGDVKDKVNQTNIDELKSKLAELENREDIDEEAKRIIEYVKYYTMEYEASCFLEDKINEFQKNKSESIKQIEERLKTQKKTVADLEQSIASQENQSQEEKKLADEIKDLEADVQEKRTGRKVHQLAEFKKNKTDILKLCSYTSEQRERAFREITELKAEDASSIEEVTAKDFKGTLFHQPKISRDYYIVPKDITSQQEFMDKRVSGQYKAVLTGQSYKLGHGMKVDPTGKAVIYDIETTWNTGMLSTLPSFNISHEVANIDYYAQEIHDKDEKIAKDISKLNQLKDDRTSSLQENQKKLDVAITDLETFEKKLQESKKDHEITNLNALLDANNLEITRLNTENNQLIPGLIRRFETDKAYKITKQADQIKAIRDIERQRKELALIIVSREEYIGKVNTLAGYLSQSTDTLNRNKMHLNIDAIINSCADFETFYAKQFTSILTAAKDVLRSRPYEN